MTPKAVQTYKKAMKCLMSCGKIRNSTTVTTDKYRGAAHNLCNISYKIPVIFYNLSGYDQREHQLHTQQ